jgi:hypothetical protein
MSLPQSPQAPLVKTFGDDRRLALQHAVQRDEAQLKEALCSLNQAVQTKANLRENIIKRPYAWLAGGFFVGLWWGRR